MLKKKEKQILWVVIRMVVCFTDDCYLDSASSVGTDSPDPLTTTATCDQENTYQCLKWSTFKSDEHCNLYDETTQVL